MIKPTNQQIVAERSFAAGAASRDAEVANLAALGSSYLSRANSAEQECESLRQQVTLLREPLLYIDEVAKTSKTIISVAAAAMKMLKKIRAALAATEPKKLGGN